MEIIKSTHSVDGPESWRLTLDQDLIDTLKGSFPNWFQTDNPSDCCNTNSNSIASSSPTSSLSTSGLYSSGCSSIASTTSSIDSAIGISCISNSCSSNSGGNNSGGVQINGVSSTSSSSSSSSSSLSLLSSSPILSSSSASSSALSTTSPSSLSSVSIIGSSSRSSSSPSSTTSSENIINNNNSGNCNCNSENNNCLNNNCNSNNNNNNNSNSNNCCCNIQQNSIKLEETTSSLITTTTSTELIPSNSDLLLPSSSTSISGIDKFPCRKGLIASISTLDQTFHQIIFDESSYDEMADGDHSENLPTSSSGASSLVAESPDGVSEYDSRQSPPKAVIDSSPLQPQLDKNKESLKVKLMVRRPITQLVEQGIIPALKTSPAIHEQCKQLERAKTGDLLKAKIQQRPNRQELERRHILEHDESHVDPSLAEKQRMLKKARLADQLNSQISHRPGPLELIKKNILHTEKPIEKIVKEGLVSFKATSEGLLTRPQHPNSYITFEDDSQSSESDTRNTPPRQTDLNEFAIPINSPASCSSDITNQQHILQHNQTTTTTSPGLVTLALTIPTSAGQVVVTSAPIIQTNNNSNNKQSLSTNQLQLNQNNLIAVTPPPPPPPPPPLMSTTSNAIQVKQDTSNLFAELCQSVAGPNSSPNFLPLIASPGSLGSSASTLSPLSSVSSPPQSLTPRLAQSPALQFHSIQQQQQKSDAPGKDKNRKKSKTKPVCKARTIKFHEYKGPPNSAAAQKLNVTGSSNDMQTDQSTCETSYQLMLEQQNCLLKFLENLNKNQSVLPATTGSSTNSSTTIKFSATPTVNSTVVTTTGRDTPVNNQIVTTNSTIPHPPPLPSPALSVVSSIPPPSPAPSSYAESTCSATVSSTQVITDLGRLEKMKVSDLKLHLKKRNLPVSGPKPQLIERLRPYLPLDPLDIVPTTNSTPIPVVADVPMNDTTECEDTIMYVNSPKNAMIVDSPKPSTVIQQVESMDIVQIESPAAVVVQATPIVTPAPQVGTILATIAPVTKSSSAKQSKTPTLLQQVSQQQILQTSNEDLVREQQREIAELKRELQRSQQELLQMRQSKQQAQILLVEQPITPQIHLTQAKPIVQQQPVQTKSTPINQKLVVKQQLEAKIQKQKAAQQQAQAQAAAAAQAVQKQATTTQLVLTTTATPTGNGINNKTTPALIIPTKQEDKSRQATIITTTTQQKQPQATITAHPTTTQNLGFVWNNENQTIFLVEIPPPAQLHDANKKIINGHQRTASLPSIVFPIATTTIPQTITSSQHNSTQHIQIQKNESKPLPPLVHQTMSNIDIPTQIQLDIKPPPPLYEEAIAKHKLQINSQPPQLISTTAPNSNTTNLTSMTKSSLTITPPVLKIKKEILDNTVNNSNNSNNNCYNKSVNSATTSSNSNNNSNNRNDNNSSNNSGDLKKHSFKSENLSDVLDILIQNGELPQSALDTPTTPSTNSNVIQQDGQLLFTSVQQQEIQQQKTQQQTSPSTSSSPATSNNLLNQITEIQQQQQQQQNISTAVDNIHQMNLITSSDVTNSSPAATITGDTQILDNSDFHSSLLLNTPLNIENIDMASPMQPDCHIDDVVTKSIDAFLEQAQQDHQNDQQQQKQQSFNSNNSNAGNLNALHQHHNHLPHHITNNLEHFDDLVLELMSQQLDMDISEETCHNFPSMIIDSNSNTSSELLQNHNKLSNLSVRRDMNPSLQPSINELIQQQLHHHLQNLPLQQFKQHSNQQQRHPQQHPQPHLQLQQQQQHHNQQQQQNQHENNSNINSSSHHHNTIGRSNLLVNGNIDHQAMATDSTNAFDTTHFDIASSPTNNNFSTTPMDVCDDFDNPLASLGFTTSFSPDSNINTPPHPFSSGLSNNSNSNDGCGISHNNNNNNNNNNNRNNSTNIGNSGICGFSNNININRNGPNSILSTSSCSSNQNSPEFQIHNDYGSGIGNGGNSNGGNSNCSNSSANDNTFNTHLPISQDNILDLFNIDDFKMGGPWSEIDYAV
ncbi:serine-rich adhesin for platelets [Condylostylus longicornis]|uniref:serine-rich adhesin for platelets n=1 Tax=Condylostylus longicornis TaxID=2530218 RepID=UPI00244E50E6|nr:serine-rich adhesin for platelets [Condylostylus longicornis]